LPPEKHYKGNLVYFEICFPNFTAHFLQTCTYKDEECEWRLLHTMGTLDGLAQ